MSLEKSVEYALPGTGKIVDFSGSWYNELKSHMTIEQSDSVLKGIYESAVSSLGTTTKGSLLGYVDGDLISFVVHWDEVQAITAWVGQLESVDSTYKLKTLWQMTNQVSDGEEWSSIAAGADVFIKQ